MELGYVVKSANLCSINICHHSHDEYFPFNAQQKYLRITILEVWISGDLDNWSLDKWLSTASCI